MSSAIFINFVLLLGLTLGEDLVVKIPTYKVYFIEYGNPDLKELGPWPSVKLLDVTWSVMGQQYIQSELEILSCHLTEKPDHVMKILHGKLPNQLVLSVTSENVEEILHRCRDVRHEDLQREDELLYISITWPGTKWCGPGNVSKGYDDLGRKAKTDMCCRDHDFCDDFMTAGEIKHGLTNNAKYTRLSCKCDEEFRICLTNVNTPTARAVGEFYFNVVQNKCYKFDHVQIKCLRWGGLFKRSCQEYELDTTKHKTWQFFDAIEFNKPKE